MKFKINDKLTIEIKDFKPYSVSKQVKLAMLSGIMIVEGQSPKVPAENAVKSEEALVFGMTNITAEQLDNLRDEEYQAILNKINDISTVPLESSGEK